MEQCMDCPVCRPFWPKLDNARVNRADEKYKLVKMESDTMGGHDHPTTGQPQSLGRFGSTLCYPDGRVGSSPRPNNLTKRSRTCNSYATTSFHSVEVEIGVTNRFLCRSRRIAPVAPAGLSSYLISLYVTANLRRNIKRSASVVRSA